MSVPATSANLGPGFDALGLALDLRDELAVRVVDSDVTGGAWQLASYGGLSGGEDNLVLRAMRAAFTEVGWEPAGLTARYSPHVPMSRGLGSSAAAICAGVTAALALTGVEPPAGSRPGPLALQLATRVEGHADNVAACLLGGLTIARMQPDGSVDAVRLDPAAGLAAVAVIPDASVSTATSRGVLPTQVRHADAARTAGRAALIVAALTSRPDQLLAATEDWLHQPYRLPALPLSAAVVAAWREAGIPAFLSGSGPTVLALVRDEAERRRAEQVAREQLPASAAHGTATVRMLALSATGTTLLPI